MARPTPSYMGYLWPVCKRGNLLPLFGICWRERGSHAYGVHLLICMLLHELGSVQGAENSTSIRLFVCHACVDIRWIPYTYEATVDFARELHWTKLLTTTSLTIFCLIQHYSILISISLISGSHISFFLRTESNRTCYAKQFLVPMQGLKSREYLLYLTHPRPPNKGNLLASKICNANSRELSAIACILSSYSELQHPVMPLG